MKKFNYSNEIANVVKQFLTDDDWHYSFDEERGIFDFGLRVRSKIQKIKYLIDVKEDEMVVYTIKTTRMQYITNMKENNSMKNMNMENQITTNNKMNQCEMLPGGGFFGGEQKETLPGGGFHGGEQKETLPGGGFH